MFERPRFRSLLVLLRDALEGWSEPAVFVGSPFGATTLICITVLRARSIFVRTEVLPKPKGRVGGCITIICAV